MAKRKDKIVKKRSRSNLTWHHRKPRSSGGGNKNNLSRVPENLHQAYHVLFERGYPIRERIVEPLNSRWVSYERVLFDVPTEFVPKLLKFLAENGLPITERALGLTDLHRKRFGKNDKKS